MTKQPGDFWTAGIFLLLIVVLIIIIATFDWNRLKPTINQKVSTELNRPFAIRGDLGVVGAPERGNWLAELGARRTFMPTILFSVTRPTSLK